MTYTIIIPARLESTRLARKMLLDVAGLPLIVRTALQAKKTKANNVVVATDSQEIIDVCNQYHIEALKTFENHFSGTDRIAEIAEKLGLINDEIVINLQGDEPLIQHELIDELADFMNKTKCHEMATIVTDFTDLNHEMIKNNNIAKVVANINNEAIYFSRAAIPFSRDVELAIKANYFLRHIGIYAYRASFLKAFHNYSRTILEQLESLEQLRILYYGHKIKLLLIKNMSNNPRSVDTIEDLNLIRNILQKKS